MVYIRKCSRCGCYTESEIITDDSDPHIICEHCGFLMDVPPETLTDISEGKVNNEVMESNRGLHAGDIVTEVRSHPYIKGGKGLDFWDFTEEVLHFEIIEVLRHEYRCRYIDGEDSNPFYWQFWDKQPNYGFLPNGSSVVRYHAP